MSLKRIMFVLVIAFSIVIVNSCKSDNSQEKHKDNLVGFQTTENLNDIDIRDEQEIYYRFPSAREMFLYINDEDFTYRTDLVNLPNNVDNYLDSKSKTLNLGVYLADLSYMTLFGKTGNLKKYMNAIAVLSEDLRLEIPYEKDIFIRINKNINNNDSIINIADEYYSKVIDYLMKNNKEKTLAVISIGGYIEGLYIAINLTDEFSKNSPVIQRIAEQKLSFENLKMFTYKFRNDRNASQSIIYLNKIMSVFNEFKIEKQATKIKQYKTNSFVIEGGNSIIVTKEQYMKLKNVVTEIRMQIIENY